MNRALRKTRAEGPPDVRRNPVLMGWLVAGLLLIPSASLALDLAWNLGFVRAHGVIDSARTSLGGRSSGDCWKLGYRYTDFAGVEHASDSVTSTWFDSGSCGAEVTALARRVNPADGATQAPGPVAVTVWVHRWFPAQAALVRNGLVPVWLTGALLLCWVAWVQYRFDLIPLRSRGGRPSSDGSAAA